MLFLSYAKIYNRSSYLFKVKKYSHSESILPILLILSMRSERSSMTENSKQSQFLKPSSRSGKDATPRHRGCIHSTLRQVLKQDLLQQ